MSLIVALLAGVVCFGIAAYKYTTFGTVDYTMVLAGMLLVGIGVLSYGGKEKG